MSDPAALGLASAANPLQSLHRAMRFFCLPVLLPSSGRSDCADQFTVQAQDSHCSGLASICDGQRARSFKLNCCPLCVCVGRCVGTGKKESVCIFLRSQSFLKGHLPQYVLGKVVKKKVKEKTLEAHLQNYLTLDSKKSTKNPKISSAQMTAK